MKKTAATTLLSILIFMPSVAQAVMVNETCLNDTHLYVTFEYALDIGGSSTVYKYDQTHHCTNNCTNNKCVGTTYAVDMTSVWLVYGVGVSLLIMGTALGVPFGKLVGKEDISTGWDTTTVVRYVFFFVGFLFVYLSLSMTSRISSIYGGDANIVRAANTAVMVMRTTLLLFFFVFFVELIFYIVNYYMKTQYEKKWRPRGE